MIIPADKGRSTVVMDREIYDQKIQELLSDGRVYKRLQKDPSPSLERRMNELLLPLKKAEALRPNLYHCLRSSAGKPPLLYGLPKVHKPNVPLRPIVSFVNSPTYHLSKHLVNILSPLVGN